MPPTTDGKPSVSQIAYHKKTMLANGQNSSICLEENCLNPFADSYLCSQDVYNPCLEETAKMNKTLKIPTLCACGCGEVVWNGRLFRNGHNSWGNQNSRGKSPWNKGKKSILIINRTCLICGKVFQPKTFQIKNNWGKYCSHECKGQAMLGEKNVTKRIEVRQKISQANKINKKGQPPWNKGKPNPSAKNNSRLFRKGHIPWNKGKSGWHFSKEFCENISNSHIGLQAGYKNPAWKGGISFIPYCSKFNYRLKEQIRERDSRTCQLCGIKENGQKLSIHHVHYDKENCEPDLISLCRGCNSKVNINRDYYEACFIELLQKRGLLLEKR